MPKPPRPSLQEIVDDTMSAALPAGAATGRSAAERPPTLKERARQLSVYLEPAVHDQLREIAFTERTKMHTLMLEGLDLLFRQRGARPIREL